MTKRAPMLPRLTEKQVTEQIVGFLRSRNWYCLRIQSGLLPTADGKRKIRVGSRGVPDYVCIRAREALFVEMKRPDGAMSADQIKWFEWAEIQGIQRICADGLGTFIEKYGAIFTR